MRISELAEASGLPVATIKYYLREGLLHPGEAVSATRADYGAGHVRRLAVIRALVDLVGIPIARVRAILAIVDQPDEDPYEAVGRAVSALPPYPAADAAERAAASYPRARAAIERLGWVWDPRFPAVAQLEAALAAVEAAGIPADAARIDAYGAAAHAVAEVDLAGAPSGGTEFLEYAVVGTPLYEPVLLALRRLAHQDVSARALGR